MSKLTTNDICRLIKKFRPRTREDFEPFGLRLKVIGEGFSRTVYSIYGYPGLVVKIPDKDGSPRRHSLNEIRAYKRLTNKKVKKYRKLWKHVPKFYAWTRDGVILMKRYKVCRKASIISSLGKRVRVIGNLCGYLFPENEDVDVYPENMGLDEKGNLKILDLGCFFYW
jgi:hypothetical protein